MASRSQVEAPTTEADFLTFKALNREPLLLSPPVTNAGSWKGPTCLFSVSNTAGWFAAGREQSVVLSPLMDLRAAFSSRAAFQHKVTLELPQKPTHVKFALNEKVLLVALLTGQIACYDTNAIFSANDATTLAPTQTLVHSTEPVRYVAPNPYDRPNLVAILRGRPEASTSVEIIDLQTMSTVLGLDGASPQQRHTCVCWSPKGKQFVVGNRNGELIQYNPEGEQKAVTPPPAARSGWAVSSVSWMENNVFHAIYASPGVAPNEESYEAYTVLREKTSIMDINHPDPAPAFGDRSREAGRFFVHLRDWAPAKHLLIVADPPSTDVGIIYCKQADDPDPWATLELEETSRIVLPIDDDGNDTYPLGLDVDLTSQEPVDMSTFGGDETPPAPPSPILYLYTNAGSLLGYHVLNKVTPSYPSLGAPSTPSTVPSSTTSIDAPMMVSPITSAFGSISTPTKPSAFGAPSFGSPQSPSFGKPAFGAISFGDKSSSTPGPFSSTTPQKSNGGGFGAFASQGGGFSAFLSKQPSVFGSTTPTSTSDVFGPSSSALASSTTDTGAFGATPTAFGTSAALAPSSSMTDVFDGGTSSSTPTFAAQSARSPFASGSWGTPTAAPAAVPKPSAFGSTGFGFGGTSGSAFGTGSQPSEQSISTDTGGDDGMDTVAPAPDDPVATASSANESSATAVKPASVVGSTTSIAPAKGFGGFGGFGTGQSAFSKPPQTGAAPTVNAFGSTTFAAATSSGTPAFGGVPSTSSAKPAFGSTSTLGGSAKPLFGATSALGPAKSSFGAASAPMPQESKPAATSTTPSGGGFSAFRAASSGFSAFSNPGSKPAFAAPDASENASESLSPPPPDTSSKPSTAIPSGGSFGLRSVNMDQEDEDEKPSTSGQFDEEAMVSREPETLIQSNAPSKVTNVFGTPLQGAGNIFGKKDEFASFSLSLSESAATSKPPSNTIPGSSSRPSSSPSPPPGISSPSSSYPSKEPSPVPQAISETAAESVTPGLPEKPTVTKVVTDPTLPTTATPVPSRPPAPTSAIGLGRPPSAPTRLGSPFSTAPIRSSPLAASPPISRKDVTDSPSPPRPKASGGPPRHDDGEEEPGEVEEEHLKELARKATEAKESLKDEPSLSQPNQPSVPSQQAPAAPTPVPARPIASEPISDAPKTVIRPKTPPLSAFGFGFGGGRKSTGSTPIPSSTTPKAEPPMIAPSPKPAFAPLALPPSVVQSSHLVGTSVTHGAASVFKAPAAPSPAVPPSPVHPPEAGKPGINSEVDRIIKLMEKELQDLQNVTRDCAHVQQKIAATRQSGTARFDQQSEWGLADLKALRRRTDEQEDDTLVLEDRSLNLKTRVAELQSLLLRAETNKQGIERFLRAKEDKNFAKLLKVRELGPEHIENRTKLRQSIQIVQDRVRQLGDQVATMKRRVERAKSGESGMKAPTLDVISRAISNIEAGALARRDQMNALSERLDAILPEDDDDLPEPPSKLAQGRVFEREDTPLRDILTRPTITRRVASATAAALNAERSSARIKQALLSVRKSPPINTSIIPKPAESVRDGVPMPIRTASISIIPKTKDSIRPPVSTSHSVPQLVPPMVPASFLSGNTFNSSPLTTFVIPPGTRLPDFYGDTVPVTKSIPADKTPSPDHGRSLIRSNRTKQHGKSASIRPRESPASEQPPVFASKSGLLPSKAVETSPDASSGSILSFGPLPSSGPVRNPLKFGFTGFGNTSTVLSDTVSPTPVSKRAPSFTSSLVPPIVKPSSLQPSSLPPRTPSPEHGRGQVSRTTPPNTPPPLLSRLGPPPTAQERKEAGAQLINQLAETDVNDDRVGSQQGEGSGACEQEDEEYEEDEHDETEYGEEDEEGVEDDHDDEEWEPDGEDESDSTENS